MKYRYFLMISALALLFACKPELDDYSASNGNADFSTYISLGNSLTAGYADGSLYRSAQLNSYPNILAKQFAKVGGGSFTQPLLEGEYGILSGKTKLGYSTDCLGVTGVGPVSDLGPLDNIAPLGYAVNNLGVPGAKSFHLLAPGYGNPAGLPLGLANPYYVRFAGAADASVIGDAMAMNATFFSLWIGNNDVLGYATTGGIGDSITGQPSFAFYVDQLVSNLTANGAKGVIANLPGITGAAFFNTIVYDGLVLDEQIYVDALNAAYSPLGITFNLGPNAFIMEDANAPGGLRQMTSNELILLTTPQDSMKCAGWGSLKPLPNQYVLSESELTNINSAIDEYNATIQAVAAQYGLALVDMNSYFNEVESGLVYDGETFTVTYVTGGVFSLDGIHLTQKGYALVANKFIEAINNKFSATIPMVSTTAYPGIAFP